MIPGIGTTVRTIMVDGILPIITTILRIPVGRTTRPRIILIPSFTMAALVQVVTIQGMAVTPWIHVTSETREGMGVELERGEEVVLPHEPATRMEISFRLHYRDRPDRVEPRLRRGQGERRLTEVHDVLSSIVRRPAGVPPSRVPRPRVQHEVDLTADRFRHHPSRHLRRHRETQAAEVVHLAEAPGGAALVRDNLGKTEDRDATS